MAEDGDVSRRVRRAEGRVAALRRARLLEAMVQLVDEHGFAGVSVGLLVARAKVSTRTFYECFEGLEDCFGAVLDAGMERMATVMLHAFAGEEDWLDGLLAAEAAVLTCLDDDLQAARVLLVQAFGAGAWVLERRQDNVTALRELIVEQFKDTPLGGDFPPLAASGVMASVIGIMHDHLVRGAGAPMLSLLGPLMGVITAPYLDPEGVAREVRRGEDLSTAILDGRAPRPEYPAAPRADVVPAELLAPGAHRARQCVRFIAEQGRQGQGPSNREIGAAIGIAHQGQVSTLLRRLAALGLLAKRPGAAGHPNAWSLTEAGKLVAHTLTDNK